MSSAMLRIYRVLGRFWLRRRTGLYARFVESWAYGPTIAVIAFGGFVFPVCVIAILLGTPRRFPNIVWVNLFCIVAVIFLLLAFLTSFGATAVHSSEHAATPKEFLDRCEELLSLHGFRVEHRKADGLRARRGAKALAESEWRSFPIEVIVTVRPAGNLTELSAQCTAAGLPNRFIRELVLRTSIAVAELDASNLTGLDRTIVLRQRALIKGGLARTIFGALTISALLTALTLIGLISIMGSHFLEYSTANSLWWLANSRFEHVRDEMDLPLRLELDSYLTAQRQKGPIGSPEEVLKGFKSAGGYSLLLAVKRPDGSLVLLQPEKNSPVRPLAEALLTAGPVKWAVQKFGDRIFKSFLYTYRRHLASFLSVPEDDLIGGSFLTTQELASRTGFPDLANNTELTIFQGGVSILRYRWGNFGDAVKVDEGSTQIPDQVIRATMGFEEFSFLNMLIRPKWSDTLRRETRDGVSRLVIYQGAALPSGWSGYSYTAPAGLGSGLDTIFSAAVAVGFIWFWVVLVLITLVSTKVSGRISRPVLQVRDALRSIAEGDYSVRIESKRTDEIGQLQKLVNHTAEELRKRESIKELMGKYLSKQVADRILESGAESSLAGSRKEISVLFADVRGFTTYSEKHDPEQVTRSLNEYFEIMVDVIASHEGVLDKYIGDGLMVVFGAPMAQPDHASRAVITALEMQAALQSLNLKRIQRGEEPIYIGIGVNTGLAISGNLGSIKRMEFTVIGDTVNLAARLESRASQGQVLIGSRTYEKVKDLVVSEALGQITVKGKTEPVDVWMVTGLKLAKPVSIGIGLAS